MTKAVQETRRNDVHNMDHWRRESDWGPTWMYLQITV